MEDNIHSLETKLLAMSPLAAANPSQHYKSFQELYNMYNEITTGALKIESEEKIKENEKVVKSMKQKASKIKPMEIKMKIGKPIDKDKEFTANIKDLI